MKNNIQKDLLLFNQLVQDLLQEEQKTPISKLIQTYELKEKLDLELNDEGVSDDLYKKTLQKLILATPKSSSKRFFNQLFGGRHSKAVLGDLITVFLNNSMATYKIAGPQVAVEKEIIRKVCSIIGYKEESGGTFPTGGSMSNFMSLVMARDKADHSIREHGSKKRLIVYTSKNSHYSIMKNVSFSGIGTSNIRYINTNNKGQIDIKSLKDQINKDLTQGFTPFYLNATAGTTVLGAFDNISEIIPICKENNIWLHLDGAFGGTVIFSSKYKYLVEAISETDSFCFNAHKTLGAPLSTSVLVVKEKKHLFSSFNSEASYLYQTHNNEFNLGRTSFECGRRNNALKLWSMWKSIGTKGIASLVEKSFSLADFAREYIEKNPEYTIYSFQDSVSICFNYKDYDPEDLCTQLYINNKLMVGFGSFKKNKFIRLVTINTENENKDILSFFKLLEQFTQKNHHNLKKI